MFTLGIAGVRGQFASFDRDDSGTVAMVRAGRRHWASTRVGVDVEDSGAGGSRRCSPVPCQCLATRIQFTIENKPTRSISTSTADRLFTICWPGRAAHCE